MTTSSSRGPFRVPCGSPHANAPGAVSVNLETATATGEGRDRLLNVKNVLGSAFDDTLTGSNKSNWLDGGPGNDTIYGRAGRDMLKGSEGDDALFGESTDDYLDGGPGFDSLDGGSHRMLGGRVFGDACVEGEALLNCEYEEPRGWWPPR